LLRQLIKMFRRSRPNTPNNSNPTTPTPSRPSTPMNEERMQILLDNLIISGFIDPPRQINSNSKKTKTKIMPKR
jgi:hypothetical protein